MIDNQFIVKLQGKDFALFAGILDAATKAGMTSVVTTPVQIPTPDNGRLAVMKARVEFADGRAFEAIGDASPESVGKMIVPHILRMAETRAIGRALRWALNISVTMREELSGDEEPGPSHQSATNGRPAKHAQQCEYKSASGEPCKRFLTGNQCNTSKRAIGHYVCSEHLTVIQRARAVKAQQAAEIELIEEELPVP
jgi:hypothetical protein